MLALRRKPSAAVSFIAASAAPRVSGLLPRLSGLIAAAWNAPYEHAHAHAPRISWNANRSVTTRSIQMANIAAQSSTSSTRSMMSSSFDEAKPLPPLTLQVQVKDHEVLKQLYSIPDTPTSNANDQSPRQQYVLTALRIGVVALQQAMDQAGAQSVRSEVDRMLTQLRHELMQHQATVNTRMTDTLRDYFDPNSGRLAERVSRLVNKDGEIAEVLRREISGQDSAMMRRLEESVGPNSALMRVLDPSTKAGVVSMISESVRRDLEANRGAIMAQFSLDNKEGSLSRIVTELGKLHSTLSTNVTKDISTLTREFTLDEPHSALSRLIRSVEAVQQRVAGELSLNAEGSALTRLRRELLTITDTQTIAIKSLERLMTREFSALSAERKAQQEMAAASADKSRQRQRTTHDGLAFEAALISFLATRTGNPHGVSTTTSSTTMRETQDGVSAGANPTAGASSSSSGSDSDGSVAVVSSSLSSSTASRRSNSSNGNSNTVGYNGMLVVSDMILESVGSKPGLITKCKVGDAVITLGPDHAAAGARIVIEGKQEAGYTVAQALAELDVAKKNRSADVGLFVYSARTAPEGMEAMSRYGSDIICVWDAENAVTDVYLDAALSVAKAIAVRRARGEDDQGRSSSSSSAGGGGAFGSGSNGEKNKEYERRAAAVQRIEKTVREVERQIKGLDDIRKSAETAVAAGNKIITRARLLSGHVSEAIAELDDALKDIK